jgi:cellulose synthase/poly-beta-1,6-N-acetylglucosamine synthase-like glycosyltransferase
MSAATSIPLALSALALAPAAILFAECAAARPGRSGAPRSARAERPSVVVLIPAHDEDGTLGATLDALRGQLGAADRILVVADNCTDDTAAVALRGGAQVVERRETARRGKGFALRFGLDAIASSPPEVVIVIDADCRAAPGAIDALARACRANGRPVQASYVMCGEAGSPLARFAFLVKNDVRPRGLRRLGLPCQLTGTGMAVPWALLERIRPEPSNLVEDLQLGADLARAGFAPLFEGDARVESTLPMAAGATRAQRMRWEHGHLATLVRMVPRLAATALRTRRLAPLALAADLAVPPLALLALVQGAALAVAVAALAVGAGPLPLAVAVAAVALLAAAVGIAWLRHGRDVVSARELLGAPLYALRKVPVYARFLVGRQRDWVRTERDR